MIKSVAVIIFLFSTFNSYASDDPNSCVILTNDADRLNCYDLIFKKSVTISRSNNSQWKLKEDISKIDDSKNVFLTLNSKDTFQTRFKKNRTVSLLIMCRENTTSVIFNFADVFMSDNAGGGTVTFRIDKEKAFKKNLRESTDNNALGLWSGGRSIPFIKSMFDKDNLLMRFAPYNESFSTVNFNITGLKKSIIELAAACGWKV